MTSGKEAGAEEVHSRVSEYDQLHDANTQLDDAIGAHVGHPMGWATSLEQAARNVGAAFAHHRDRAEAPDGNLERIAQERPGLIPKVTKQRTEHAELLSTITSFCEQLAEMREFHEVPVDRLRLQAGIVHDSIRLHLAQASDLLYEAYFRDEGGQG